MSNRDNSFIVRVDNIVSALPSSAASSKRKIFTVDQCLRSVNESAYEPRRVAIGPIHRGKDHLKDFDHHKVTYLEQLLHRRGEHNAERYVVELMELEEKARECYSTSIKLPEGDEFVEMLLLDGVFVIEYIRRCVFYDLKDENDYIFQIAQVQYELQGDLMLMENQLPFCVLSQLFGMTKLQHPRPDDDLHYLLLRAIGLEYSMPFRLDVDQYWKNHAVHSVDDHLLGLVHQTYIPGEQNTKSNNTDCEELENTASGLEDAGVEFKTAQWTELITAVSFTDGVLHLPKLYVQDDTEIMLSNLVAYEQMTNKYPYGYMAEYIGLMTKLVKSTKDVEILRRSGVIEHVLEDDRAIHLMINRLGKNVLVGYFYSDILQSLNEHCLRRRNKWMANLKRNYFNTPWATISVIAAIILLVLTIIQTVFTIIG